MRKTKLIAGAAIATALCALPVAAQDMKKGGEGPSPGPAAQSPQRSEQQPGPAPRAAPQQGPSKEMNRGAGTPEAPKGSVQRQPEQGKAPSKGAADSTPKATPEKGQAPKSTDNKAAPTQDKNKAAEQPSQDRNKSADRPGTDRNKAAETPSNAPRNAGKDDKPGDRAQDKNRVQLSEKQRTDVHRDVFKDKNINRVNVNINVRVGGRVPRNVHLAVLPAAVVAVVPAYRTYRYFVVAEEVYIVEPTTYEVVEIIPSSGGVVAQAPRGPSVALVLNEQERLILLGEVDLRSGGDSTLGLGALTEGSPLPRGVRLVDMPVTVVDRIPRLQGYKYFVAEQRVAIVDPQEQGVQVVIDANVK